MKIFVINLAANVERRMAAAAELQAAGRRFRFFPAIEGAQAVADKLFERIDHDEFLLNTGRQVLPGEIGCFASHRALWTHCVDSNEPLLVLEDDLELLDGFDAATALAAQHIDDAGFLRLQTETRARTTPVLRQAGMVISRYTKAPHSTLAYCIAPRVAKRWLAASRVLCAPVDVFIRNFWEHGECLYGITPYAVRPSPFAEQTTIGGRVKRRKPLPVAVARLLRKATAYWQRWRFNRRITRAHATAFGGSRTLRSYQGRAHRALVHEPPSERGV